MLYNVRRLWWELADLEAAGRARYCQHMAPRSSSVVLLAYGERRDWTHP
jgi:hypothetical protein